MNGMSTSKCQRCGRRLTCSIDRGPNGSLYSYAATPLHIETLRHPDQQEQMKARRGLHEA